MVEEKTIPTGVKVLAILEYIGAVFLALLALALMFGGGMLASFLGEMPLVGALAGGLFIVMGIIILPFAVLFFFIGRGLWKGQNWARIVSIVFAALGFASGIFSLIVGDFLSLGGILINGLIGWYLLFNVKVKEAFA
jgi:hypothetical protein